MRLEHERASATRCCSPPESIAGADGSRPKATFSKTLRCGNSAYCWKTVNRSAIRRVKRHVASADAHPAFAWDFKAGDHPQRRRFAASRGADE